ncbi:hypothetical protein FRC12_003865 [Ceratobasidium sp. 428]|nr:hypothetical protein FRC12_003865 [Ceratobasidium sp. 428]
MNSEYDPATKISVDIYDLYGQKLLERFHKERLHFDDPVIDPGQTVPNVPSEERAKQELPKIQTPVKRVAIVGAGVAGLYAAMLLKGHDYEFPVDIYEASDRIGGRLYTHRFDRKSVIGTPAPGKEYDYFDVGAMRFPNTPIMAKTYELFKKLEIDLLDYKISNDTNWLVYNGRRISKKEIADNPTIWESDPFRVSMANGGTVPDKWAKQDPGEILHKEIKPFIDALVEDPSKALDDLIDNYDHFSTRSYLAHKKYPPAVISWIETLCAGTGWFDRALIETILEEMAFSYNQKSPSNLKWRCVDGGSEVIPIKMVEWLKKHNKLTEIRTRHRVTMVDYKVEDGNGKLFVSGISHPLLTGDPSFFKKEYSHVIFAVPPPCLRMIDLDTCQLDYAQRNAMRQLQLAPSIKIGMKFKTAWWAGILQDNIGGQSTTDRTARTIVYPSHGQGKSASTVLIVSYAWTSDALVLGAMMHGPESAEQERLKQIMLADLAYVHKNVKTPDNKDVTLTYLIDQFEYMYAFDWQHNPLAMGAFGLFGPSQFREFYRHVTRPSACGQIFFVGETFSTTHGWVAGALNSAERGVLQLLQCHKTATENKGQTEDSIRDFLDEWSPHLEVKEETIYYQFIASLVYQFEEFGNR